MPCSKGRAWQLVTNMAALKMSFFPDKQEAMKLVSGIIERNCVDDLQADYLEQRMLRESKWTGPEMIFRLLEEVRPPDTGPTAAEQLIEKWKAEQAADDLECPTRCCAGMLRGANGKWVRCTCKWGRQLSDEYVASENRGLAGFDPREFESLPTRGEKRDRELERERVRIAQQKKDDEVIH